MRLAVSADMRTPLVDALLRDLAARGHEVVFSGPEEPGGEVDWPLCTREASERVASGEADEGIVMCWTGTGASLCANKVPGVRAALCADAETARGARKWNHANVLALSLRKTSEPMLREILDAWFSEPWTTDDWNVTQVERIAEMDDR
jgi:ribose 5-phosphate isomerase B